MVGFPCNADVTSLVGVKLTSPREARRLIAVLWSVTEHPVYFCAKYWRLLRVLLNGLLIRFLPKEELPDGR